MGIDTIYNLRNTIYDEIAPATLRIAFAARVTRIKKSSTFFFFLEEKIITINCECMQYGEQKNEEQKLDEKKISDTQMSLTKGQLNGGFGNNWFGWMTLR